MFFRKSRKEDITIHSFKEAINKRLANAVEYHVGCGFGAEDLF